MNVKHVCVLGDGQLARFLCQAAKKAGLKTTVVGKLQSPAAKFADEVISSLSDFKAVSSETVVTFENEFLDIVSISQDLERLGLSCLPDLKTIEVLREKKKQKQCLQQLGIATPSFMVWRDESVDHFLLKVSREYPKDSVLKWSTGGYDSKGVFFFGPGVQLAEAASFCESAREHGHEVFAEEKVQFEKEMALVASRDDKGFFRYLPLVETWQDQGICRLVRSCEVGAELQAEARGISEAIMSEWDYVGVMAVEFFLDQNGQLFVNELAPRVHNSGHFSLSASEASQFDMHLAAVCARALKPNKHATHFAMWNLLGPARCEPFELKQSPEVLGPEHEGIDLFWYDKVQVKPRRKMGHLCATADTAEELETKINAMIRWEEIFWENNCK